MSKRSRRSGNININLNNNHHQNRELDLKLNLSPPRPRAVAAAAAVAEVAPPQHHRMSTSSPDMSPPRSCVSSEDSLKYSSSPESTSMVLVGCPRCLMYVMLSEADPRCPKCKSTVLLDFLRHSSRHDNDVGDFNCPGGRRGRF